MILAKIDLRSKDEYNFDNLRIMVHEGLEIDINYRKVLGLGERYNTTNHKGQYVVNMVEEKFCNQGTRTYFTLPFFLIDTRYGFFLDTKEVLGFNFGDTINIEKLGFDGKKSEDASVPGHLYVLEGSMKEMVKDFVSLTGNQMEAPKWTFGPWISAHRWNSQDLVDDVRSKLKDHQIPVTALVLEQWSDEATFYVFNGAKYPDKELLVYEDFDFTDSPWKNPKGMIEDLHKDGIRLILWQCPVVKGIPEDEPFNARHDREWKKVEEENLAVLSPDGPYLIPEGHWFHGSMIPDFSNPSTIDWWFNNRKYLVDLGVDGFKTDGGEFIYGKAHNYIGETEKDLKNNYSLEYVKAYGDFLGDEQVAFSRAGYVGQQSHTLLWAGDQKSTFEELQSVYNAGINASICGQINWGFDIGGFSGELPSLELYIRSNQLAVFSPIMQVHSEPVGGQFSVTDPTRVFNNERTPWNMAGEDMEMLESIASLYRLRMNILPYIYSEYKKALEEKLTLMKHTSLVYQEDLGQDVYLFGDLIVAPVLKEGCEKMSINFPQGDHYNIFTGHMVSGQVEIRINTLYEMFVFAPAGSALVTCTEEILPLQIDNGLDYHELHFRLYGPSGTYRYVDNRCDFIIKWQHEKIEIIGEAVYQLHFVIIN